MTDVTVKDLMAAQEERLRRERLRELEEEEAHASGTARAQFKRKPYYMDYGNGGRK